MQRRRHQQGFTLIEMIVVVAIIGIIAAIALPNLMNAMDRSRQNATVADMRTVATALERFAFDHYGYPVVDGIAGLRAELAPRYLKKLPVEDAWDHPLVYEVDETGVTFTLLSPGKDGELQPPTVAAATVAAADDFAADIVMIDGVFVRGPAAEKESES